MIDEKPIETARRLARREEQNRCLLCGREKCVEQHHVAGEEPRPGIDRPGLPRMPRRCA